MKIDRISDFRGHSRVDYQKPFRATADGEEFEGMVQDVSAGGAALRVPAGISANLDNELFVQLHIDSLGGLSGRVTRTFEGGFAVAFEMEETQRRSLDNKIEAHRGAGTKLDA